MAKVLVLHCTEKGRLPQLSPEEVQGIKKALDAEIEKYPGVEFQGTFANEEGQGVCCWEAPSAEEVKKIVKAVMGDEAPVDAIIEVQQVL